MKSNSFPRVTAPMLAEALRELLPVAAEGVRSIRLAKATMAFRRAETVLTMWVEQKPGRREKLKGPLPSVPKFPAAYLKKSGRSPR